MYADWYKPLFELAKKLYQNQIYAYYFDILMETKIEQELSMEQITDLIYSDIGEKK